jgi:hypothetical protein
MGAIRARIEEMIEMRELLLAAATSIALTGAAQAKVGFNLLTYEQCADLLGSIAGEAEWVKAADWYEAASGAFVLAAAEERGRIRGEASGAWLQIKLEALAVRETLDENYNATGQEMRNNPELFDFCISIGEAIVPVTMEAFKEGGSGD